MRIGLSRFYHCLLPLSRFRSFCSGCWSASLLSLSKRCVRTLNWTSTNSLPPSAEQATFLAADNLRMRLWDLKYATDGYYYFCTEPSRTRGLEKLSHLRISILRTSTCSHSPHLLALTGDSTRADHRRVNDLRRSGTGRVSSISNVHFIPSLLCLSATCRFYQTGAHFRRETV